MSPHPEPLSRIERARWIREQIPAGGLFAGHHWQTAPEPFALDTATHRQLTTLGRVLLQFYRAANQLYHHSVAGRQPGWIAQWLEQGKPPYLIELQRAAALRNQLPGVIRPDLLLVDDGLRVTELDSVPGGIGLTAWLNQTYAAAGTPVIGGAEGMLQGFISIFDNPPAIHIVVSEESAAYRPEMDWLAGQIRRLGRRCQVRDASPFAPAQGDAVYRFFELFDVDQVPVAQALFEFALQQHIQLTPPPRSFLEEKLLLALLWNRRLRDFWRQELGGAFFERLLQLVPPTWIVDPTPLPPHGAIPGLELTDWSELKTLSQKERALILKVSGFSPEAWGARGVYLGSDLSATDWSRAVDRALQTFPQNPYILQRYEKPRRVPAQYLDASMDGLVATEARARLCPYYFVSGQGTQAHAQLGGVLATLCPADKKIIHGMRDAVLAPCCSPEPRKPIPAAPSSVR